MKLDKVITISVSLQPRRTDDLGMDSWGMDSWGMDSWGMESWRTKSGTTESRMIERRLIERRRNNSRLMESKGIGLEVGGTNNFFDCQSTHGKGFDSL
jgi:hypothetical protein